MEERHFAEINFSVYVVKVNPDFGYAFWKLCGDSLHFFKIFGLEIRRLWIRVAVCKGQMIKIRVKKVKLSLCAFNLAVFCDEKHFNLAVEAEKLVIFKLVARFIRHILFGNNLARNIFIRPLAACNVIILIKPFFKLRPDFFKVKLCLVLANAHSQPRIVIAF